MTDYQKKRITLMRKQNIGYAVIAKELKLSLGAVKQFCRRNGLQCGDLGGDTQNENISPDEPEIELIKSENRANTTSANQPGRPENTGFSDIQPVCKVTISYADEPDLGAVADVLDMLTHANYGGDEKR